MNPASTEAAYTLQGLQEMLGVSRGDVLGFIRDGFVTPARGPRNAYRFGFQDVVLLRTAQSLRRAHIPALKIRRSLKRLKALLPAEMPLSGLRITAVGDDIAVREDGRAVAADSGQLLFDFEVAVVGGSVLSFPASSPSDPAPLRHAADFDDFLARGARFVDAGADAEALAVYDEGIAACPAHGILHFNRAIVLENLGRLDDSVTAYEACLALEPDFADAHWNVARLYELRGVETLALRHFSAYRRLSR